MRCHACAACSLLVHIPLGRRSPRRRPQKTKQAIKVETFAKGLVHPWGMAFLPDGRLLVTERPGRLRIVGKDGKLSAPLQGVPKVYASGQGGLLDVQIGPDFASSGAVYLSYADPRDGSRNGTSVARGKLVAEGDGGRLDDVQGHLPAGALVLVRATISARASSSRATARCS